MSDDQFKIMSPSEHYAAASGLLTRGLEKVAALYEDGALPVEQANHIINVARVHAMLAAIPQAQYNAWKAERGPRGGLSPVRLRHREVGYDGPGCIHQETPNRCSLCHPGHPPAVVCSSCGVGSWSASRVIGSRCDLMGCAGHMINPDRCPVLYRQDVIFDQYPHRQCLLRPHASDIGHQFEG